MDNIDFGDFTTYHRCLVTLYIQGVLNREESEIGLMIYSFHYKFKH